MDKIQILILGTTGVGKSALAWKFQEFLRSEGFTNVDVVDQDESFPPPINNRRFTVLNRSTKIEIEPVQMQRSIKNKDEI